MAEFTYSGVGPTVTVSGHYMVCTTTTVAAGGAPVWYDAAGWQIVEEFPAEDIADPAAPARAMRVRD